MKIYYKTKEEMEKEQRESSKEVCRSYVFSPQTGKRFDTDKFNHKHVLYFLDANFKEYEKTNDFKYMIQAGELVDVLPEDDLDMFNSYQAAIDYLDFRKKWLKHRNQINDSLGSMAYYASERIEAAAKQVNDTSHSKHEEVRKILEQQRDKEVALNKEKEERKPVKR